MQQTVKEFSGKCITSIKNWHSSTVEFKFKSPESDTPPTTGITENFVKENSPSLTLDFCVWDLVFDKKLLISSEDEELEEKLSVLKGDSILRIAQLIRFSAVDGIDSDQEYSNCFIVRITFGSGKKLFIAPHSWQKEAHDDCEPSRLMTLLGTSSKLIYLEDGGIQHSLRSI